MLTCFTVRLLVPLLIYRKKLLLCQRLIAKGELFMEELHHLLWLEVHGDNMADLW